MSLRLARKHNNLPADPSSSVGCAICAYFFYLIQPLDLTLNTIPASPSIRISTKTARHGRVHRLGNVSPTPSSVPFCALALTHLEYDRIKSLLIFFGPMLLPKAIGWYRNARNGPKNRGLPIRPVPPKVLRALVVLAVAAVIFCTQALPNLAPENVFILTQSRLQIPTDVLFNRIGSIRPDGILTDADNILRTKFVNLESRLLYLQFGPEVLAECPFCNSDEPRTYFYYAIPAILAPHLLNLCILSFATSTTLTGREGNKWRGTATIATAVAIILDIYLVNSYNHQANSRITRLPELDLFFWNMRIYRRIALAGVDAAFALLLFLSSTNRAFASPPSAAEQLETVTRKLMVTKAKLNALGVVKNSAIRDEELRNQSLGYWRHEGGLMREVMEERDVIEGVNDALSNRINIQTIQRDAEAYASSVLIGTPGAEARAPETMVG